MRGHNFSSKTNQEYTVLGLTETSAVLNESISRRGDKEDEATQLIVEENGEERRLLFPGKIHKAFFSEILGEKVKFSTKEDVFLDPTVYWRARDWNCTENCILEILSGKLAGQKFRGQRHWRDDYSPCVARVLKPRYLG